MVSDCCIHNCPNKRVRKHAPNQDVYMDIEDPDLDLETDHDEEDETDSQTLLDKQSLTSKKRTQIRIRLSSSKYDYELPDKMARLHVFPLGDLVQLELWIKACLPYMKQQDKWIVTKNTKICSEHFLPTDYNDVNNPKLLKCQAVPSVFRVGKVAKSVTQTVDGVPLWVKVMDQTMAAPTKRGLKRRFIGPLPVGSTQSGYCRALGCESSTDSLKSQDLTFHRFPFGDPDRLKKWERAVGIKNFKAASHWSLCSRHFSRDCYQITTQVVSTIRKTSLSKKVKLKKRVRILKPDAVPTLFKLPARKLMNQVDVSAPYLQPRVILRGLYDPAPISCPSPQEDVEEPLEEEEEEDMDVEPMKPMDLAIVGTTNDHNYMKTENSSEKEIATLKAYVERLKDQVMTASQKVKSLKISVSALKYQFELEQQSQQNSNDPIR